MKTATPRFLRIGAIEVSAIVVIAVILFLTRFGLQVLAPGEIDWLLSRNDPAAYYLVWDYFRYEPWSFPLGRITQYLYPLGTSLPLADALPLLAYPAKLFSPVLPPVFQFYGLWHLVCAVLQAYFGYRIVRRFVPHSAGRILGAALFLLAPVFLYREGHIALSGHWVILAAIDLYLDGDGHGWRRLIRRWCILGAIVALIHPYLTAMVLLFLAGLVLRRDPGETWPWRRRLAAAGAAGATVLVVWWIAGNLDGLTSERVSAEGFGIFSLNLNALINPMGYGTLLPNLPRGRGQYEGFAYLGAGWLLIAVLGIASLAFWRDVRERLRPHRALIWILLVTFVYALSNIVTWNEIVVLQYLRLPVFDLPAGIYRCSGRFVWPVVYAGMTGLMILVGRVKLQRAAAGLLLVALVLQVWDMRPLVFQKDHFANLKFETRLADPNWMKAASVATGITTIPPFRFSLIHKADYREFCWLAAQNRIPTTAGYAARMSLAAAALADSMRGALVDGSADPNHIYVCDRPSFPAVLVGLDERFVGDIWDGYPVCHTVDLPAENRIVYTATSCANLAEFLKDRASRILVLAVRDEASAGLTAADRQALQGIGFAENALAYRSSAAAIVDHGQVAWQQVVSAGWIELDLAPGEEVGSFRADRAIGIFSAGFSHGNAARLRLDDREEGFGGRGFNILVLDDDQRLIEVAWFDTHAGAKGVVLRMATPR